MITLLSSAAASLHNSQKGKRLQVDGLGMWGRGSSVKRYGDDKSAKEKNA